MDTQLVDMLGKTIVVGQQCTFAALSYKSAHLRHGEVREVDAFDKYGRNGHIRVFNAYSKRLMLIEPRNIIVISQE